MKIATSALYGSIAALYGFCFSCKSKSTAQAEPDPGPAATSNEQPSSLVASDTPVLDIRPGAVWRYRVSIVNSLNPASVPTTGQYEFVRRYVGKDTPIENQEADCFEVIAPDKETKKEFTKITPDEISILGQTVPGRKPPDNLIWFSQPVPFFKAGLLAGDSMAPATFDKEATIWRAVRVISREKVLVPAGIFDAVRLQMLGKDRNIALRKTYWFAPKIGIVREERVRELQNKVIYSEIEELIEYTPGK